jgi:asparagine synthase (glutamine-hydrolysing)
LVSELARRTVTVALSGIGGDELLGGYPRYYALRLAECYATLPQWFRRWAGAHLAPSLREGTGSRDPIGRLKRFLRDGDRPLAEQYVRWMTFLPVEWGSSALSQDLLDHVQPCGPRNVARFRTYAGCHPTDQAMRLDLETYLPDDLLRMGDRVSMAHSLELRVPFCDPPLLEFARTLPADVRFTGRRLKGFMRQALSGVLPRSIVRLPKAGFQVPLARWLREDLREMVSDLLSPVAIRRRGYVRPEYVEWLLREHREGRRNFTDQIYALLVLELWHQQVQHS